MTAALILAAVLAATAVVALLLRRGEGHVRATDEEVTPVEQVDLGLHPQRWSLVEFTAPSCHGCVQTRSVLDDVARQVGGIDVVAVDVAQHIDAARHHGVMRAPTTLIVEPGGHVRARVRGVPDPGELRAAVLDGAAASGAGQ